MRRRIREYRHAWIGVCGYALCGPDSGEDRDETCRACPNYTRRVSP